jgi:hypothetical protein
MVTHRPQHSTLLWVENLTAPCRRRVADATSASERRWQYYSYNSEKKAPNNSQLSASALLHPLQTRVGRETQY